MTLGGAHGMQAPGNDSLGKGVRLLPNMGSPKTGAIAGTSWGRPSKISELDSVVSMGLLPGIEPA